MQIQSSLLVVADLKQSLQFYTQVLNLELVEEHNDCLKLKAGTHEIILFQGDMRAIEYSHGYNANSTLLFTVEDLDKRIAELKSEGVVFIHDSPNQNRWGRYSAFKDPSGIVHELFELHR